MNSNFIYVSRIFYLKKRILDGEWQLTHKTSTNKAGSSNLNKLSVTVDHTHLY